MLVFILFACEKIVDIDTGSERPFVVNSIFNPDSTWRVDVFRSNALSSGEYTWGYDTIKDASVVITGDQITTLQYNKAGYYETEVKPGAAGMDYSIVVSAPEMPELTALCKLPVPIMVDTAYGEVISQYGDKMILHFVIDDPAAESNYYEVYIDGWYRYYSEYYQDTVESPGWVDFQSTDPAYVVSEYSIHNSLAGERMLFQDVLFNGNRKIFSLSIPNYTWRYAGTHVKLSITLRSVSAEYYQFRTTSQLQEDGRGDPFSQPVQVYNNIRNGTGIFAGFSSSVYTVQIQ